MRGYKDPDINKYGTINLSKRYKGIIRDGFGRKHIYHHVYFIYY